MTNLHLDTNAPRSGTYTGEVARGLEECMRVLNTHTMDGTDSLPYPVTLHDVLGSLATTAARMDQLLRQLAARLSDLGQTGDLGDTRGDVDGAVARTGEGITAARRTAAQLAQHLDYAFQATAGLYTREGT